MRFQETEIYKTKGVSEDLENVLKEYQSDDHDLSQVLETLNNTAKTNSGVFFRIGTISGPDFSTTETPPLFEGRIDTSYFATVL